MAIFEDGFYAVKNGDMYKITLPEPVFKGAKTIKLQLRPETNADRVRSMTDEELAELLEGCVCPKSPCPDIDRDTPTDKMRCTKCWLEWLRQEASG